MSHDGESFPRPCHAGSLKAQMHSRTLRARHVVAKQDKQLCMLDPPVSGA